MENNEDKKLQVYNGGLQPTNDANDQAQEETFARYGYAPGSVLSDGQIAIDSPEFSKVKQTLSYAINEAIKEAGDDSIVTISLKMDIVSPNRSSEEEKELALKSVITIKAQKQIDKHEDKTDQLLVMKEGPGYVANRRQVSIFEMSQIEEG